MRYLVEVRASMKMANQIDAGDGPAALFAYIAERFKPEALYGTPERRAAYLVVELETPEKMAELMYLFTWHVGAEPIFTPVMAPDVYGAAIERAKQAPLGEIPQSA